MPIPRTVARLNRYALNPVIRVFAGRIPPLAILIHTGRTSGREYRTPIMVFRSGDAFVIALTYGRNTDWERNVFHAGGCDMIWRNRRIQLERPEHISPADAAASLPLPVRLILKAIGVKDYLRIHRVSRAS